MRADRGHKQGQSKMRVRARQGQWERQARATVKGRPGLKGEDIQTDRHTNVENSRSTYFFLKTNFSVRDALLLDCFAITFIEHNW